MIHSVVEMFV